VLKVIHSGNAMPMSLPVDPTAEFQPGTFAQLRVIGNDIVAGVSDGTAPIGIIDDARVAAFTKSQIDEIVQIHGFKIVVNYIYRVSNRPGDDTTLSSGRVTIHYQRGIYATDQFDTTQVYPLNATLYIGLDGHLTTKQPTENHPGVAIVTGPPSATQGTLEFLLL